jgi:hypothetical protein
VTFPTEIPVNTPVEGLIVAIEASLVDHVPPEVELVKVLTSFTQIAFPPVTTKFEVPAVNL